MHSLWLDCELKSLPFFVCVPHAIFIAYFCMALPCYWLVGPLANLLSLALYVTKSTMKNVLFLFYSAFTNRLFSGL